MFNEAQVLYLEDVLGASVNYFRATADDSILVLTPRLNNEEKALLNKILTSVKLTAYRHEQTADISAHDTANSNVLAFFGGNSRESRPSGIWWSLPTLNEMIGNSPAVAEKKKSAWAMLQQFAKETL